MPKSIKKLLTKLDNNEFKTIEEFIEAAKKAGFKSINGKPTTLKF